MLRAHRKKMSKKRKSREIPHESPKPAKAEEIEELFRAKEAAADRVATLSVLTPCPLELCRYRHMKKSLENLIGPDNGDNAIIQRAIDELDKKYEAQWEPYNKISTDESNALRQAEVDEIRIRHKYLEALNGVPVDIRTLRPLAYFT